MLKVLKSIFKDFHWNFAFIVLAILSSPVWLPITTWKLGIIISDNIIKKYTKPE